jgi:hypothetical protein
MKTAKLLIVALLIFTSCSTDSESSFYGSEMSVDSGLSDGGDGPDTSPGQVTAGEWNDLDNWSFWEDLMNHEDYTLTQSHWGFYTQSRLAFEITNSNSQPANGVLVSLYKNNVLITEAKTDNLGKTNLFIDLNIGQGTINSLADYTVTVNTNPMSQQIKLISEGINNYVVDTTSSQEDKIELSFIVDATGSMSDELEFLKNDLQDVISTVQNDNASTTIRTSTVFYRDTGDEYVVKSSDFTSNISTTIEYIEQQYADGGGDYPEAVDAALHTSVNDLQWSDTAKTKIAFLLLDAPPHQQEQVIDNIQSTIKIAAKKGIRIIPIAASGIDKSTEFLMRFFAIATNGTYVFITNDSGIGNDHIEPTVGDYEVEFLNELMVRLINQYSE